jgi:pimeloyl-ACP methyl ester carboxylesterase
MTTSAAVTDPDLEAAEFIERVTARARRLDVDCAGGRLAFRIWGEGRPLLLLHGGFGSWLHWIRNVEVLAAHCQVIAVDLPGLGDSDLLDGPPDGEAIASHIAEGLKIGFPNLGSVTIAGFSLGGAIGSALAARLAPRLHQLVLLGPSGLGEMWQDATADLQRYSREMSEAERRAVTRHNLARSMIADEAKIDALAIMIQSRLSRDKPRLRGMTISRSEILISNVAALPAPENVTILWGEHDPYPAGGVRPGVEAVRTRLPGVTVEVCDNAGHWVAYEAPAAMNDLLLSRVLTDAPAKRGHAAS